MDQKQKITPDWIRAAKSRGERVAALTGYDYPTARLLDEAGVPIILVGDSVGMVVLGYPDTTQVTLAEMRHHVAAVARAKTKALVVGEADALTPPADAQAMAEAIPGSQLVSVPGAGHLTPMERPGAVAAALGDFFAAALAS